MGHPLAETQEQCEDLGKRLKRNNVAIDIINFANPENVPKLEAFIQAANNESNSHFMDVPMGAVMITDILFTSPILGNDDMPGAGAGAGADVGAGAGAGADPFAEYGGINPQLDPDLAMALKVSLEEERARAAQNKGDDDKGKGQADAGVVSGVPVATDQPMDTQMGEPVVGEPAVGQPLPEGDFDQDDEAYYLEQAIKLSL